MCRLIKLILLTALIPLAIGCVPGIVDAPTPTMEVWEATPTPTWDVSCLPDGIVPINTNPCLVPKPGTSHPYDIEWVIAPNGMWGSYTTYPEWVAGHWVWHLAGNEGERFAGFIGLRIHNLVLKAGQCYAANFDGVLDLRDVPNSELTDITAVAFIHTDNGGEPIPLNKHAVFYKDGLNFVVDESPGWFWAFWSMTDTVIVFEAGINENHANARPGNIFSPAAIYIHPVTDPGLCSGAPIH